jgi:hypothetical protein
MPRPRGLDLPPSLPRAHKEVIHYYEQRAKSLDIVKTTHTRSGQIVDWIPIESQVPDGKIATPSAPQGRTKQRPNPFAVPAAFDTFVEEGPEGTVPVLRPRFPLTADLKTLRHKRNVDGRLLYKRRKGKRPPPPPDPAGYYHATSGQFVKCYGCDTVLSLWDPWCQLSGDHSLTQVGLLNFDNPKVQSLEAGCMVSQDQYGDDLLHLFTYFTTAGYPDPADKKTPVEGDNFRGYNKDYKGFVQLDRHIYPGMVIPRVDRPGYAGYELEINYSRSFPRLRWSDGNWYFTVGDTVVGYYPSSLFGSTPGKTLADHADWCAFWGEIYSALKDPTQTTTSMGNGLHAKYGWPWSAYQRNMQVQISKVGLMTDATISITSEDSIMYDGLAGGVGFAKFFFFGGSGKGSPHIIVYPWF